MPRVAGPVSRLPLWGLLVLAIWLPHWDLTAGLQWQRAWTPFSTELFSTGFKLGLGIPKGQLAAGARLLLTGLAPLLP